VRGISFTYLCDGWRSEVKSYITTKSIEGLKKKTMQFKKGQYLKEFELWRGRFVQKVKFHRNDGYSIEAGSVMKGDHLKVAVPKDCEARCF
jgi:hypothetical protein